MKRGNTTTTLAYSSSVFVTTIYADAAFRLASRTSSLAFLFLGWYFMNDMFPIACFRRLQFNLHSREHGLNLLILVILHSGLVNVLCVTCPDMLKQLQQRGRSVLAKWWT